MATSDERQYERERQERYDANKDGFKTIKTLLGAMDDLTLLVLYAELKAVLFLLVANIARAT